MRIAIGQIWQETNTFNPLPTTRQDFEDFGVLHGDDMLAQMADTNELGAFIQSLRKWPERPEIVGLARLPAWPSGLATAETFAWLKAEFLAAFGPKPRFDAVLLALHGAMAADGHPDIEGEILEAVRARIGPRIPLVATLDLHANITPKMAQHADALVLFHTAPHIDVFETGLRGASVLRRILDGARPTLALQKIPMVPPVERANTQDPASVSFRLREKLQALEARPDVLAAGLATVQPWLDIPELGSAVVVVTDNDADLAKRLCGEFAAEAWQRRREYLLDLTSVDDAVRGAFQEHGAGLVVLGDGADATTSGAPGDSTCLLRKLIDYDWSRPALITLVAPEVVADAQRLGVGGRRKGPLGGVRDHRFCTPLTLETEVVRLFDARFTLSGHLAKNLKIDMGPSAVLRHKNVFIVVTSRSGPHFAPQLFETAGLAPFAAGVLVAKSPCGFRAAYQEQAHKIIAAATSGCAPADFWRYDYQNIPQPLWPWREIEAWAPAPLAF
jgi:microcystin degradation protein MlrC